MMNKIQWCQKNIRTSPKMLPKINLYFFLFMIYVALFFTTPLITSAHEPVFGGTDVGSGGFAVVKDLEGGLLEVELYDHWEWCSRLTTEIEMGPGDDYTEHLFYVITRLKIFDLPLALKLEKKVNDLLPKIETSLLDRINFSDPKDYNNLLDPPPPYRKEIFALFVSWPGPGELKYMFRKELWVQAPSRVKAGILLHELLYDEAVKEGAKNSDSTRRFNTLISSRLMNTLTKNEYFEHKYRDELIFFDQALNYIQSYGQKWKGILQNLNDPKTLTTTLSGALRGLVVIMAQPTPHPDIFSDLRKLSDSLTFTYSDGRYAPLLVFQLYDPSIKSIPSCQSNRCPSIGEYLLTHQIWLTHDHWDKAVQYILKIVEEAKMRFITHKKASSLL